MKSEYAAVFIYTEDQNEPSCIEPTLLKLPSEKRKKVAYLKEAFIELAGDEDTKLEQLSVETRRTSDRMYGDYEVTDGFGTHLIATIVNVPK